MKRFAAERRRQERIVYAVIVNGDRMAKIARRYKVCSSRIREIVHTFCKRKNRKIYDELSNEGVREDDYIYRSPSLVNLRRHKLSFFLQN